MIPPTIFWQGLTLAVFAAVMGVVWMGLDWFVNAIPPMALVFIAGAGGGLCFGFLMGERSGRALERRLASEARQSPDAAGR